jgi:hypothetical protein
VGHVVTPAANCRQYSPCAFSCSAGACCHTTAVQHGTTSTCWPAGCLGRLSMEPSPHMQHDGTTAGGPGCSAAMAAAVTWTLPPEGKHSTTSGGASGGQQPAHLLMVATAQISTQPARHPGHVLDTNGSHCTACPLQGDISSPHPSYCLFRDIWLIRDQLAAVCRQVFCRHNTT